jgi:hypothetical protein
VLGVGVSNPELTSKMRNIEEDNSLLRQRLSNALFRLDALALAPASDSTSQIPQGLQGPQALQGFTATKPISYSLLPSQISPQPAATQVKPTKNKQ